VAFQRKKPEAIGIKAPFPGFIEPALATSIDRVPNGTRWISAFNALHSRKEDHEVQLYAFDCLAYDGNDLSRLPLHLRKQNLAQLLRGRSQGIFVASVRAGRDRGRSCSRRPAAWGFEGSVSKHGNLRNGRDNGPFAGACLALKCQDADRLPGTGLMDTYFLVIVGTGIGVLIASRCCFLSETGNIAG